MSHLTAEEVKAARDWAAGVEACTCPTVIDEATQRPTVKEHTCPVCRQWRLDMLAMGIGNRPAMQVVQGYSTKPRVRRRA